MKKAILLRTDGIIQLVDVPEPRALAWYGQQIGCSYIETVYPRGLEAPHVMVVDEEGLLKEKPIINYLASYLYQTHIHGNPICGNVLVMDIRNGIDGRELVGIGEEAAEKLAEIFKNQFPIAMTRINQTIGDMIMA